jgi:C-5 cytosine-specific DNA methylase
MSQRAMWRLGVGVRERHTIGSLCSGVGGLDRGLHRAGWRDLRWACERQSFRRRVLRRHWGPGLEIHEDLETFDAAELEPVDLLAAGTPCPDFSHAKADRRGLERAGWESVALATRRHSGNRRGAAGQRAPETVWLSPICVQAQRPLMLARRCLASRASRSLVISGATAR